MCASLRDLNNMRPAPIEEVSDEETGDIPFNGANNVTEDQAKEDQEEDEDDEDDEDEDL